MIANPYLVIGKEIEPSVCCSKISGSKWKRVFWERASRLVGEIVIVLLYSTKKGVGYGV